MKPELHGFEGETVHVQPWEPTGEFWSSRKLRYLVGGWTNPSEKYESNWIISPNRIKRGENKNIFETTTQEIFGTFRGGGPTYLDIWYSRHPESIFFIPLILEFPSLLSIPFIRGRPKPKVTWIISPPSPLPPGKIPPNFVVDIFRKKKKRIVFVNGEKPYDHSGTPEPHAQLAAVEKPLIDVPVWKSASSSPTGTRFMKRTNQQFIYGGIMLTQIPDESSRKQKNM